MWKVDYKQGKFKVHEVRLANLDRIKYHSPMVLPKNNAVMFSFVEL